MKLTVLFIILISPIILMDCESNKKMETPEILGQEYIRFINDGADIDDFKSLVLTEDDIAILVSKLPNSTQEDKEAFIKRNEIGMKFINDMWNKYSTQIDTISLFGNLIGFHSLQKKLELRPYDFISIKSERQDEYFKSFNKINAIDKNGKTHIFSLQSIANINGNWKIFITDNNDVEDIFFVEVK